MTIGKNKKPEKSEATNQNLKGGLTTQEAAAIVRAATRGVSPSFRPEPPKADSGQGESGSGQSKPGGVDEDWIAKTIAKTAALVSSGAASVSKEEMIKAERLKRAKMFASMIKSSSAAGGGPPLPHLLTKVESTKVEDKGCGSNNEVVEGDNSKKEKLELGGSEREKRHHEKNYRKHDDSSEERERSERKRVKYCDEENCEESSGHHKKHHKHRHRSEHRKRNHSSSDEERERTERKRERHSHKDREEHNIKREGSRHRKDYSSSDSEEEGRHHRRSHREERRKSSSKRSRDERERSLSNAGEKREDSADVPDELRAKIRAMLLQTL